MIMDYRCGDDSRAHDSGYFTPSPDKDINNKLLVSLIHFKISKFTEFTSKF
jgi:hypothetical protein